jgi:hypothetical protein
LTARGGRRADLPVPAMTIMAIVLLVLIVHLAEPAATDAGGPEK